MMNKIRTILRINLDMDTTLDLDLNIILNKTKR